MILILIAIFILILFMELPELIRKKLYKEVAVFMGFYVIGIYLSIAFFYNWPLYNPFEAFVNIFPKY